MKSDKRSTYGSDTSEPDEKAGVEVGGGDKAAAATDERARDEAHQGHGADSDLEPVAPEDPDDANPGEDERHEKRPEGPYKDPADEKKQAQVK